MLHIKLKGMEHRACCKHKFCHYTPPWPLGGVKTSKRFQSSHAIKLKGNGALSTLQASILSLHTPSTCGSGSKINKNLNVDIDAYQIKGNDV